MDGLYNPLRRPGWPLPTLVAVIRKPTSPWSVLSSKGSSDLSRKTISEEFLRWNDLQSQTKLLSTSKTSVACLSHTPAFRLAEQWINGSYKKIEVFTAENGSSEEFVSLRKNLQDARGLLSQGCEAGDTETPCLQDLLKHHLRLEDFRPAEIPGAYWLHTPMGEIPLLALPEGDVNELSCRSKAHILVGLASSHEENPVAGGFLYLSTPSVFQRYAEPQGSGTGWLQSQRILPVDAWGLRVLLVALRCSAETRERLISISNPSSSR